VFFLIQSEAWNKVAKEGKKSESSWQIHAQNVEQQTLARLCSFLVGGFNPFENMLVKLEIFFK